MKRKKFRLYQKNNKGKLWKITLIIQKIPKGGQNSLEDATNPHKTRASADTIKMSPIWEW